MADEQAQPNSTRRFFLAEPPGRDGRALLLEDEEQHALRVLRLELGAEVLGLDGLGGLYPLELEAREGQRARWRLCAEPRREPEPGSSAAAEPWIGLAIAWPRPERAEAMLERLVQLGAMAVQPLATRQAGPHARALDALFAGGGKHQRLQRIAREACKQARRSWLPVLQAPATPCELRPDKAQGALWVLDPQAESTLLELGPPRPDSRSWIAVGPEGGFHPEELAGLLDGGARPARIAPHILRIETAAEAALAILQCAALSSSRAPR